MAILEIMDTAINQSKVGSLTNRIVDFILTVTAWIVVPIQIITTFVLGIFVTLTFGLLLLPLSLLWVVLFLYPLLGFSYLWERVPVARPLVSLIGIPLAIIANTYVCLIPSMGETDSRIVKLLYCQTFPYTWRFHQFHNHRRNIDLYDDLNMVFQRVSKDVAVRQYLHEFSAKKRM